MLAAFLKAIGFIIPLMDAMYANYYTREVMVILIRCVLQLVRGGHRWSWQPHKQACLRL